MSRADLIRKFMTWTWGPIDVERDVKPAFLAQGVKDEIWFWYDPKLNPGIIRGLIEHWEFPDQAGKVQRCVDITCAEQMPNEWQRLVCCKEMLHILDTKGTNTPEDIEQLIEKIILPPDLQDPFTDGAHANTDRVAVTFATAVLFPFAARQILMPVYEAGKLPLPAIADKMEIPLRSAALVMSDVWPEIHKLLIR